jgi:hypothetical protein
LFTVRDEMPVAASLASRVLNVACGDFVSWTIAERLHDQSAACAVSAAMRRPGLGE